MDSPPTSGGLRPPNLSSLFFVANEGQWEEPFSFKLTAAAATYFVMTDRITIDIRETLTMSNRLTPRHLPSLPAMQDHHAFRAMQLSISDIT